jgi:8-oxo-dGTP pyrophosphatase MutT (NUDIX family)
MCMQHRKKLLDQIARYRTSIFFSAQEQSVINNFIDFITANEQCFEPSNKGHITTSIWIINAENTHALLTHHKKFNIWIQLGGHNDGIPDCKQVALQEAQEESGISEFTFLYDDIFDIDIHAIPGPCEYHYDIRYLLQAPKNSKYLVSDESHDLAWIPFEKIVNYSREPSVLRMNEKALNFLKIKTKK